MVNNKYDYILISFIAILAFGEIGNGLQLPRLFTIILAPFMLHEAFAKPHASLKYYRYECVFLYIWWMYALSTLYKAEELLESAKHIVFLFVHIVGFLEIIWLALKANNPQRSLAVGWMLLLTLTLPIAFYEYITDFHLPLSVQDTGTQLKIGDVYIDRPFASVTYGNLNSYNTVLCWMLPTLMMWNLYTRKKIDSIIGMTLLLFTIFVIVFNSSRGALLCVFMLMTVYSYCYFHIGKHRIIFMVLLGTFACIGIYLLIDVFALILDRFGTQGLEDDGRSENIVKGINAFLDSYGMGIGIGNYDLVMSKVYRVMIPAPHNLFLEILVVYGIVTFIGFIGMITQVVNRALKGTKYNHYALYFFCTSLLFAGIIDSAYIMKVQTWYFFATMLIFTDRQYNFLYTASK